MFTWGDYINKTEIRRFVSIHASFFFGKYHTNQLWGPIQLSEMARNGKSKGFGEKCIIKMAHILDFLHRVILVERNNAEVVHCRVQ
jgi:hypothetical protein